MGVRRVGFAPQAHLMRHTGDCTSCLSLVLQFTPRMYMTGGCVQGGGVALQPHRQDSGASDCLAWTLKTGTRIRMLVSMPLTLRS